MAKVILCSVVWISPGFFTSVSAQQDLWSEISAGALHTCAIVKENNCHGVRGPCSAKGSIECFGNDRYGQATPPPGVYESVSAGRDATCAIQVDGTVRCWGRKDSGVVASQPGGRYRKEWGRFRSVSVGSGHACGLQGEHVTCWGADQYGQASPPDTVGVGFKAIDCGTDHTCGILTDGHLRCWGHDGEKQSSGFPPLERFTEVAAGTGHTCGLTIHRRVECWGRNREGQSTPPPRDAYFMSVSAGHRHSCAVRDAKRTVDAVLCWGSDYAGESRARFRAGLAVQVTSGATHACALTEEGEMRCWGSDKYGQARGRAVTGLRGSG